MSVQQAYKNAFCSKPAPPPAEHLDLAIELVCCSVQFCWAVEFFELVDDALYTAQRFKAECNKLVALYKCSKGRSKSKDQAAAQWARLPIRSKDAAAMHRLLLRAPDYVTAYLCLQIARRKAPYLGWREVVEYARLW